MAEVQDASVALHHCVFQVHPFAEEYFTLYFDFYSPSVSQFNLLLRRMDQSEKPQNNWGRKSAPEIILSSLVAQSRLKQRRLFRAVSSWVFSISKMETP